MGEELASQGYDMIFGGGHIGLMGEAANGALSKGGKVTGVIPDFLEDRELGHKGITELIRVGSMHERKSLIAKKAQAFIALPGGFGTLEEISEILTWAQLGLHQHPFGFLNTKGYYNDLKNFFNHMATEGFLKIEQFEQITYEEDPEKLLVKISQTQIDYLDKWLR